MKRLKLRWLLAIALSTYFAGLAVGSCNAHTKVEHHTETVTIPAETPEPEVVEVLSEDCEEALKIANRIWRTAGVIDSSSSKQLDIISNSRVAIGLKDFHGLYKAETQQRSLQASTTGAVIRLSNDSSKFRQAYRKCK